MDENIIKKCREIIQCDTARISKPLDRMFLIIGFFKKTIDDKNSHFINEKNERIDFEYVEEHIVSCGYTEEELIENTKEYVRLSKITMEDYLKELI